MNKIELKIYHAAMKLELTKGLVRVSIERENEYPNDKAWKLATEARTKEMLKAQKKFQDLISSISTPQ